MLYISFVKNEIYQIEHLDVASFMPLGYIKTQFWCESNKKSDSMALRRMPMISMYNPLHKLFLLYVSVVFYTVIGKNISCLL